MNATNQNHDPTQPDDHADRLVDLALSELIGGNTPPDLSSRIAAATFRQTAAVAQVPRTRQDRAFWVHLAIAVMLLIGVTIVLLPQGRSFQHRIEIAKASPKQDRLGSTAAPSSTTLSVQQLAQLLHNHADSRRRVIAREGYFKSDAKESGTSNLGLDASGPQSDSEAQAQPTSRPAGPEGGSPLKDRYGSMDIAAAPELQPAAAEFGVNTSDPNQKSDLARHIKAVKAARAGLEMGDQVVTKNGRMPESENMGLNGLITAYSDRRDDVLRGINNPVVIHDGNEISDDVFAKLHPEGTGPGHSGDKYTRIVENPFIKAEGGAAVSTFSIDVDTASYANVRQFLLQMNQLPPPDAVRIEELINYFHYDYAGPGTPAEPLAYNTAMATKQVEAFQRFADSPFAAHVEITACPWAPEHRLARIGIKGREMDRNKRPQSNLVFLVDVSGSMNEPAKLPLVVYGLEQLTRELGENDHIAIVVYAGTEGLVLPSTSGSKQDTILAALAKLQAGGSTAGGAGIQLAYQIAEDNFIKGGTNRVILCTDGDFNVGVTNTADLQRLVEKKAKDTGVFLSTLGFGRGNLNDAMIVAISDHGNGNYHYIDNRTEARRVLVEEMTGTLVTIAKDVKIQVEFNPAQVAGYRLIGYEKRMLRTEDFNDDKKDAGEIGAGHTVTALYEIVPTGKQIDIASVDPLKYQQPSTEVDGSNDKPSKSAKLSNELLTLKMRYKASDGDTSKKLEWPVTDDGKSFSAASGDLKFAASVAGFGLLLRNSQYKGNLTYAADIELAQGGIGEDPHGYRKEFLDMVRKAKELRHE